MQKIQKMQMRWLPAAGLAALLVCTAAVTASAEAPRGDKLLDAEITAPAPARADMAIWVGEVELRGKKRLWVELIDAYGEVVYDAEVKPNETHILPDGSAIVVRRSSDGEFVVAKAITDRVPAEVQVVRTRRVVTDENGVTTIEFLETTPKPAEEPDNDLMRISKAGQQIWAAVVAFFATTADTLRTAWSAVVNVFTA